MGSGNTILIISNEEMNYIMKITQALEDSDILLKGITKTTKNETKEQKGWFLSRLLATLGANSYGQNVILFGVDMSFTIHIDNKKGHMNIKNRSNTRITTYFNCRKNVFY